MILFLLLSLQANAFKVTIDPGHGGTDTGAVKNTAVESKIVLNIALELENLLKQDPLFTIIMTRSKDELVSLPDRVTIAEKSNSDLLVSLHANSVGDPRAKGIELFFQNSLPPDEESLLLAHLEEKLNSQRQQKETQSILSKENDIKLILEDLHKEQKLLKSLKFNKILADEMAQPNVSIKQAPFYMVSKTSMPSVLIEVGFLTNKAEAKKLLTSDYQKDVAKKIFDSIKSYAVKLNYNQRISSSQSPESLSFNQKQ